MTKRQHCATILTIAIMAILVANVMSIPAFAQQYTVAKTQSTIRVTGDATMRVEPDQAVMIVVKQSQPTDLASVLNDQKSSVDTVVKEIKQVIGNDQNSSVTIGQMSLNPSYWGNPSYSDISTFTIYSTTSIDTTIENFSNIVKKLTEAGFGFESVYAGPYMAYAGLQSGSGSPAPIPEDEVPEEEANKITLNVTVNTQPGKLNDVLDEYDEKYAKLIKILQDAGFQTKDIKPSNVNINPFYYGPNQSSIYQTYSQVIVKTDVKNIEKITAAAKKIDAYVESTSLSVSDAAIEKVRDEVNKQALENAKTRADALASIAGLKVQGIKNIDAENSIINPYGVYQSYKGLYIVQPYYYQSASGEIASSITVEFELVK